MEKGRRLFNGKAEEFNFEKLLAVNKIDLFKDKSQILDFLRHPQERIVQRDCSNFCSSQEKHQPTKNFDGGNLPFKTPEFSKATVTDKSIVFRISEIVREKLMKSLRDELPIACL
ncbi:MAG: hypothetical protein Ct9H300mP4_10450 [Gammaproteobacteria bacterium]|nr:MAG: hypothetical protein Ct9H300mP4_10450 [Gammaproteobacteria bacterium]